MDGAHEIGNYRLLVMRRNEEGISMELFGLGRCNLTAQGANDKEDDLVQKADREQRNHNLVKDHDGRVGL